MITRPATLGLQGKREGEGMGERESTWNGGGDGDGEQTCVHPWCGCSAPPPMQVCCNLQFGDCRTRVNWWVGAQFEWSVSESGPIFTAWSSKLGVGNECGRVYAVCRSVHYEEGWDHIRLLQQVRVVFVRHSSLAGPWRLLRPFRKNEIILTNSNSESTGIE